MLKVPVASFSAAIHKAGPLKIAKQFSYLSRHFSLLSE